MCSYKVCYRLIHIDYKLNYFLKIKMYNTFENWKYSLCQCFEDTNLCVKSIFCPCMIHANNYYRLYGTNYYQQIICCILCCPIAGGSIRKKIQNRLYIRSTILNTYMIACVCPCCTAAQGEMELNYYNISPPLLHDMI